MRFMDDAARINYQNWNKGGKFENHDGAREVLSVNREDFRAFLDGRSERLPEPFSVWGFPEVLRYAAGKDVLCLANGGGQQSVAFSMLGCRVSVLDISELQLERDRLAAEHHGYDVVTIHGDMRDLSAFQDASFDLVFQNVSIVFVPDVRPVYREVARVLRPGGYYEVWHCNPATYAVDLANPTSGWDGVGYRISESSRPRVVRRNSEGHETFGEGEPMGEYVHPLSDIFGGLVEAGLTIQGVSEESEERAHFGEPLEPGSEMHKRSIVPLYFGVLARKELTYARSEEG
ncbi:MAG: class I SAM-dependent methyltransferase [Armatimonadota bacterium]|nr:MAG: class I SAM-dependent methyltransferase [Armatimonadota bacterium]